MNEIEAPDRDGWLEIKDTDDASQVVHCPHRGMIALQECLGCKRCDGLAMDRDGARIYVVCTPHAVPVVESA